VSVSPGASFRCVELILINPAVADVLEAKLVAVNQHPVLQCPTNDPQTGRGARLEQTEDRVKKNRREKMKRGCERHHLERISRLFKVARSEQTWTRVDVLIFGMVVYLLVGSTDYSPNSLQLLRSSSTAQVPFRSASSRSPRHATAVNVVEIRVDFHFYHSFGRYVAFTFRIGPGSVLHLVG